MNDTSAPIAVAGTGPRRSRQARAAWGSPRRHDRRRRAGARAVDDQYRHGRRDRHRDPGEGARAGRLRARADHRQHARGRRRGAARPRPSLPDGLRRAADRRLPLQRPPPADRAPGDGARAQQVPHQPRQRRQGRQARPPVRDDGRGRVPLGQVRPHRRQLGQPRPGAAGVADGRERAPRRARGRQAGHVPARSCSRRSARPSTRASSASTRTRSSSAARSAACRT